MNPVNPNPGGFYGVDPREGVRVLGQPKELKMKIEDGQCNRCHALIHLVVASGMRWTADPEPLEAGEAAAALLAGRELYRVALVGKTYRNLSPAKPAVLQALWTEPGSRPIVVASHGCPTEAARKVAVSRLPAYPDYSLPPY